MLFYTPVVLVLVTAILIALIVLEVIRHPNSPRSRSSRFPSTLPKRSAPLGFFSVRPRAVAVVNRAIGAPRRCCGIARFVQHVVWSRGGRRNSLAHNRAVVGPLPARRRAPSKDAILASAFGEADDRGERESETGGLPAVKAFAGECPSEQGGDGR